MHIISRFLYFAATFKLYHWSTQSEIRHRATDDLYGDLQSLMDKFVEQYIGAYGRKDALKGSTQLPLKLYTDSTIFSVLNDFEAFLITEIPKHVKSTDLLNVRDELLGALNKAKYKFSLHA